MRKQRQIVKMGGLPGIHKICSWCGLMKRKYEFQKNVARKDGLQHTCRECRSKVGFLERQTLKFISGFMLKLVRDYRCKQ